MLTIAIIDNHTVMRIGLSIILKDNYKRARIQHVGSITEFCTNRNFPSPDLVILGVHFERPELRLKKIRTLQTVLPNVPLIVYDGEGQDNLVVSYLQLGVKGCLQGQHILEEIIKCVEAVIAGQKYLCPVFLETLVKLAVTHKITPFRPTQLTAREFEVATYLSNGMRVTWIARTLDRKVSTISTLKKTIFRKMSVQNLLELRKVLHLEVI
jgi:DNA-binding NarL/FixJ family response regulator